VLRDSCPARLAIARCFRSVPFESTVMKAEEDRFFSCDQDPYDVHKSAHVNAPIIEEYP
jgi:hypothetical protein